MFHITVGTFYYSKLSFKYLGNVHSEDEGFTHEAASKSQKVSAAIIDTVLPS